MLDIDDHKADDYLSEFVERRAQGTASPLDRANTALLNADQVACILTGAADDQALTVRHGDDYCSGIQAQVERVALAASAVAIAERQGDKALAAEFANYAETEALRLDGYAHVRIKGLTRFTIHGA